MAINELLIFLLASAGMSVIVTKSSVFKPLRDLFESSIEKKITISTGEYSPTFKERVAEIIHKLISCPLCFGFWSGLFIFAVRDYYWGMVFCYCLCASIFSLVIYSFFLNKPFLLVPTVMLCVFGIKTELKEMLLFVISPESR